METEIETTRTGYVGLRVQGLGFRVYSFFEDLGLVVPIGTEAVQD